MTVKDTDPLVDRIREGLLFIRSNLHLCGKL